MSVDFERIVYIGEFKYTLIRKNDIVTAKQCLLNSVVSDKEQTIEYKHLPLSLKHDFDILARGDIPAMAA
ncbi:hypothetical protein H6789_01280 [Candidatus Nomurabacteria bacterium]|nr:hypothetical protein [Candidatus Nomurabacteria bacterium]